MSALKRLNTPLFWLPLAFITYVLVSGLSGACPMCVEATKAIGLR